MDAKGNAMWLKGFLDSLEYSDTISKSQISLLKSKLDELIKQISNDEITDFQNTNYDASADDDLPF